MQEEEYLLEKLVRQRVDDPSKRAVEERREESEVVGAEIEVSDSALSPESPRSDLGEIGEILSVSYGLPDEHGLPVDYAALFYGAQPAAPSAYQLQDEEAEDVAEDAPAEEIMTVEEGEDVVQEAQYAVLTTGNTYDIDPEELRRLDLQIKIDPSLLAILTLNALTRDVNYAPWV